LSLLHQNNNKRKNEMTRIQQAKFLMDQMILVFEADISTRHPISDHVDLSTVPSLSNHELESIANYAWAFVTSYTRQSKYTEELGCIPLEQKEQ
jgi:hypothetical protein